MMPVMVSEPGKVAVLSCGDVVTEWDPPAESYGGRREWHWTTCPHPLCRRQRRMVMEIRDRRPGDTPAGAG